MKETALLNLLAPSPLKQKNIKNKKKSVCVCLSHDTKAVAFNFRLQLVWDLQLKTDLILKTAK